MNSKWPYSHLARQNDYERHNRREKKLFLEEVNSGSYYLLIWFFSLHVKAKSQIVYKNISVWKRFSGTRQGKRLSFEGF